MLLDNTDQEHLRQVFTEAVLSAESPEDGMRYDEKSIEISSIREETEYGGTRILLYGYLETARIRLQFDIGVGDAITPSPELTDFPVLLDGPIPRMKAYPMATTIEAWSPEFAASPLKMAQWGGISQEEQDGNRTCRFQGSRGKSRVIPDTSILSPLSRN